MRKYLLISLLCGSAMIAGGCRRGAQTYHQLELSLIGRPTAAEVKPARKINELFFFNGRLYIGHGCYVANTGATDILYYDPASKRFVAEGVVDDEAIVRYRNLDGRLVVPGIDATEDWSFGNCYVLGESGWQKRRSIPKGLHVFDIAAYRGRWYAVTHSLFEFPWGGERGQPGAGMVLSSGDEGVSWRFEYATACEINADGLMKDIIVYRDRLYAFPYAQTFPNTEAVIAGQGPKPRPIYDAYGSLDAVMHDGMYWRGADLIRDPGVRSVTAFTVKDKLALWVEFRPEPAEAGSKSRRRLYEFDGKTVRRRPFQCEALRDMLIKPDRTFLLLQRDGRPVIAETEDLIRWKYYAFPDGLGDPRSLEHDGESFYVGTSDGSIYKGREWKPAGGAARAKYEVGLSDLVRSAAPWLAQHDSDTPGNRKSVATFKDGRAYAMVWRISPSYGNCDTRFVPSDLAALGITPGSRFRAGFKDKSFPVLLGKTYSDVAKGQWVAFLTRQGYLRIARNRAGAAELLGCKRRDVIFIEPLPGSR